MKNKFHHWVLITTVFFLPILAKAQAPADVQTHLEFWKNAFGSLTAIGGAIVITGALLAIVRLFTVIMKMEEIRMLREKGIEEVVEAYRQPEQSWWSKFMKAATKAVPVSKERDIDLGHDYDGIRELDNKLPPWWLWMFYASIIFGVIYFSALHITGSAPSIHEEYEQNMEVAKAEVAAFVSRQADQVDENNVVALTDEADLSLGQSTFQANCTPCHGTKGEGNTIGPNLTDDYWIHGGGIKNVFTTIKYGYIEKGMQSWKDQLRSSDMQRVASYVLSLRGSNPPNAKAPQGDLWKPDGETATPADSTATGDAGHTQAGADTTTLAGQKAK
ncbi:MAG: cbb3-type cytochrome c oxidase N-terminal domain-containing protein [Saprospiraceae bacterium]